MNDVLLPSEVAIMFRVDPKTVTRWANNGKLTSFRTPGGHRRFSRTEVGKLMSDTTETVTVPTQPVAADRL